MALRCKHPCVSNIFIQMRAMAINQASGLEVKISQRNKVNSPMNPACDRLSVKASAEVTHCYAHSAPWFLIKWNCIGTRCAFKPRPNSIPSPLPLSSGQEWCNSCNFMIHWMQLLDLSVFWPSFCLWCMQCADSAPVRVFTYSVSLPHTGTLSHMAMHRL